MSTKLLFDKTINKITFAAYTFKATVPLFSLISRLVIEVPLKDTHTKIFTVANYSSFNKDYVNFIFQKAKNICHDRICT